MFVCPRHISGFWKTKEGRCAQCLEQQHETQVLENNKNALSAPKKVKNNKTTKKTQNNKIPKIQVILEENEQGELNIEDDDAYDEIEDDERERDENRTEDKLKMKKVPNTNTKY